MNKQEFLEVLKVQLQVLDEKEQKDILDEYALHIDMKVEGGLSEEEAIQDFGTIQELAGDILEAYHVNPQYCTPTEVEKKAWKTPDMGKIKEESVEVCAKAGGFCKRKAKAFGAWCGKIFSNIKGFFGKIAERLRGIFHREKTEPTEEVKKEKQEKHYFFKERVHKLGGGVKAFFGGCKALLLWCLRICWNLFWFGMAALFGATALVVLFAFGFLIVCNLQGYPLTGVTIAGFGVLLGSLAFTGLALSFCKKKKEEVAL